MRKRIGQLDVLRAVGAFAVVLIHITAYPMSTLPTDSRSFFFYSLANQWSRFSIPAFVLITGIVLCYGYGQRTDFQVKPFLVKRLQAIALPYLIWSVLYMLWRAKVEASWALFPQNLALSLVQGTAMYQLYFVVLIFQFYLLFPLIRPLGRSRWLGPATVAALVIQGLLMWDTYYGLFTPQITAPWAVAILAWRDRLFLWWIGYFMAGVWIASRLDGILTWGRKYLGLLLAASVGLLTWMMVEYMRAMAQPGVGVGFAATGFRPSAYLYSLVAILALLGFGTWALEGKSGLNRVLLELGTQSFGIFLIHPAVLELTVRAVRPMDLGPLPYLLVVTTAVMIGSYGLSRAIAALPFGHWIVGKS